MKKDDARLDGCDLAFDGPERTDDDWVPTLVMFADVFDDDTKVQARRTELVDWSAGIRGDFDA